MTDKIIKEATTLANPDGLDEFRRELTPEERIQRHYEEKLHEFQKRPGYDHIWLSDKEFATKLWIIAYSKDKGTMTFTGRMFRPGFINVLNQMGFYKRENGSGGYIFIKAQNNVIEEVSPAAMKSEFFERHFAESEPLGVGYRGILMEVQPEKLADCFLRQSHLIFNSTFLEHLPTHNKKILRDDRKTAYFPYRNGIVKATEGGHRIIKYSDLREVCVWRDHIIDRDFEATDPAGSHYERFIHNVCNNEDDRIRALRSALGYLLHNYSEPSKGQVVIFYDETPAKRGQPGGGRGKGLAVNGPKQIRNTAKIDGKKFDDSDRFRWQTITRQTQVLWIDDVHRNFDFEVLHSCSTDGMNIEQKHRDEFFISAEDSPKIVIASNTVLANEGTTNKRRQFIVEFSDHYSRHIKNGTEEPIRNEHGCMFFTDDWDETEWKKFDTFMIRCVQSYLLEGLQPYEFKNLKRNQLLQNTSEDFAEWADNQQLSTGNEYNNSALFVDFRDTYYGPDSGLKQRTFTKWMKRLAGINGWETEIKRSNGNSIITFYES